jgi:Flp pilus assembly protein TadB
VLAAMRAGGVRADVVALTTGETDRKALRQIASAGAGSVVVASDAAGLASAFTAAAQAVPVDVAVDALLPPDRFGPVDLEVVVTTGAGEQRVLVPVAGRPAGEVPPTAAPRVDADPLPVTTVAVTPGLGRLWLLGLGVFVVLALVVGLLWPRPESDAERRTRAMRAYTVRPVEAGEPPAPQPESPMASAAAGVVQVSERLVAARGQESAIALRLDRAAIPLRPAEWVVLRACSTFVAGAAAGLLSGHHVLGTLAGALVGWAVPGVVRRVRAARRQRAFADQLPDTLQLVASSLRSGFSLPQALAAAHEHGTDPMAPELGRALAAARLGVPLEDELELVAMRMRNEDWRWAVMAVRIQRSVGGNLADVLDSTARTLRERASLGRQVTALSAEGRLSAYILIALPLVVGAFLLVFRREYLEPLWTTTPGLVMVAVSGVALVLGWVWMSRVVSVEV